MAEVGIAMAQGKAFFGLQVLLGSKDQAIKARGFSFMDLGVGQLFDELDFQDGNGGMAEV